MAGKLTTHILDVSRGIPALGLKISIYRDGKLIRSATTNRDGRLDEPLLSGEQLIEGNYRLEFAVGDYFTAKGDADAKRFLDVVPVEFHIDSAGGAYHVPLLVAPWSYTTYRGS